MNVHLMFKDEDFMLDTDYAQYHRDLERDLGLEVVLLTMAQDDRLIYDVAKNALLSPLTSVGAIQYRQEVLKDCLAMPDVIRKMYFLAGETLQLRRKNWMGIFSSHPSGIVHPAVNLLELFMNALRSLRELALENGPAFHSEGFRSFCAMLHDNLDDAYLTRVGAQLSHLKGSSLLVSAQLEVNLMGSHYTLVKEPEDHSGFFGRLRLHRMPSYTFHIDARDEAGNRALEALVDESLNQVANALGQSSDHVVAFFQQLQRELAFYLGGLNLHDRLTTQGEPITIPEPLHASQRVRRAHGLYDVGLALRGEVPLVGNDLDTAQGALLIVTGANRGGKSTFLRSLGLAQLMMQAGLFVSAEMFAANICEGVFTHFRREEDAEMRSGQFDDELRRMSAIADHIVANSLILFNESFASTNEREGAKVFQDITDALLEARVQVFVVTHMYAYAASYFRKGVDYVTFLRAERGGTFKLRPAGPLPTSYGQDLYETIFAEDGVDVRG